MMYNCSALSIAQSQQLIQNLTCLILSSLRITALTNLSQRSNIKGEYGGDVTSVILLVEQVEWNFWLNLKLVDQKSVADT